MFSARFFLKCKNCKYYYFSFSLINCQLKNLQSLPLIFSLKIWFNMAYKTFYDLTTANFSYCVYPLSPHCILLSSYRELIGVLRLVQTSAFAHILPLSTFFFYPPCPLSECVKLFLTSSLKEELSFSFSLLPWILNYLFNKHLLRRYNTREILHIRKLNIKPFLDLVHGYIYFV